jgi:hypothetical protein
MILILAFRNVSSGAITLGSCRVADAPETARDYARIGTA